ncbi:hypothetical protein FRC12_014270 [Ceratobasidium sp. 428]|nr:hypothetical protein FRC12_014270 [Ceratobasidium sp. 428]
MRRGLGKRRVRRLLGGWFKTQGNATTFDEFRAMRDEGQAKFWAFHMPWFDNMIYQLALHDGWISQLPWTRPSFPPLDLDSIVRDLTGDGNTECVPPTNETYTCICSKPVVAGESEQNTQVAQCDRCLVRFHAKCIEGSCPFCDDQTWDRLIGERTLKLQRLDSQYKAACELTQHYSPEYRALKAILYDNGNSTLTEPIIKLIKHTSQQDAPDPAAVPQIRHFMRKLYRIQLETSARPEVFAYGLSLAHLYRQMTMQPRIKQLARRKPKFVFKSEMNPKALDGSRCLCNGPMVGLGWPNLRCSMCQLSYHRACIALSSVDQMPKPLVCPLCSLKDSGSYGPAEVRVTYQDDDPEENAKFVDVKACLDSHGWSVIRRTLPPPVRETIYVELFLVIPGTHPDVEELQPRFKPARGTPVELTPRQHAYESSNNDEGFISGSESN